MSNIAVSVEYYKDIEWAYVLITFEDIKIETITVVQNREIQESIGGIVENGEVLRDWLGENFTIDDIDTDVNEEKECLELSIPMDSLGILKFPFLQRGFLEDIATDIKQIMANKLTYTMQDVAKFIEFLGKSGSRIDKIEVSLKE